MSKPVLEGRMQTGIERSNRRRIEVNLSRIGESRAATHFLAGYAKPNTKRVYSYQLARYFDWLRESKGVTMSPDDLIQDNLVCVFKSDPVDVQTKKKHTVWMNEYINVVLLAQAWPEGARANAASVIKQFYGSNDSALFGSFKVSSQDARAPPPALGARDIRAVLRSMPLAQRLPLLIVWQSGMEINRVLGLTWSYVKDESPLKLTFYGRKRHKKEYSTFIGTNSIEGLKLWREMWVELQRRELTPADLIFMGKGGPMAQQYLNTVLKQRALALHRQGLVENGDPESWHSHFLRHSFETEASHAGVKAEIRDYFLGHLRGIQWTYNHRDEIHPEDLAADYRRIEPFISLDQTEITLRDEYEETEKKLLSRVLELERRLDAILARSSEPLPQREGPQSLPR